MWPTQIPMMSIVAGLPSKTWGKGGGGDEAEAEAEAGVEAENWLVTEKASSTHGR